MPWEEYSVIDERPQFVARRLAGEAMADLCREFGISRQTGYKILGPYQEYRVAGTDRQHHVGSIGGTQHVAWARFERHAQIVSQRERARAA